MRYLRLSLIVTVIVLVHFGVRRAEAETVVFDFPINVFQEVPTPDVRGLDPLPSGHGLVTYHRDTMLLEWLIDYADLSGQIVSPGAHLHGPAVRGDTAGVQVFLTDGNPPEPATGQLVGSQTISEQQASDLLAGLWYVNIHTQRNSAGEIRGQVVPEPASLAMLQLGGMLLLLRRTRRPRESVR